MFPFFFRLFNSANANTPTENTNPTQTPQTEQQNETRIQTPGTNPPSQSQNQAQENNEARSPTTESPQENSGSQITESTLPIPVQLLLPEITLMMSLLGPMAPPLRIVIRQSTEPPQTQSQAELESNGTSPSLPTAPTSSTTPSAQPPNSPQVRQIMLFFPAPAIFPSEEQILNTLFNLQQPQGPPPASQQAIEKLPNIKMTEEVMIEQPRCSICCDDFMTGAEVAELPCKHVFDRDCIVTWLKLHNTCPVCRHCVRADEEAPENSNVSRHVVENNSQTPPNQENDSDVELSLNDEERMTVSETQETTKEVWELETSSDNIINDKIKEDDMRIEGGDEPRAESRRDE